jgi:hypothetical protein
MGKNCGGGGRIFDEQPSSFLRAISMSPPLVAEGITAIAKSAALCSKSTKEIRSYQEKDQEAQQLDHSPLPANAPV